MTKSTPIITKPKMPTPISAAKRNNQVTTASTHQRGWGQLAEQVPAIVGDTLRSPGQALDGPSRDYFEPRFGHDFSQVRIHSDEQAARSTRALQARAYAAGNHIAVDSGRTTVGSDDGRHVLAHELAHVVQQRAQPQPSLNRLTMTHPNDASEREAAHSAVALLNGQRPRIHSGTRDTLARLPDAGAPEAGPIDAGAPEAGPVDAGAAPTDAGVGDADAGGTAPQPTDAGAPAAKPAVASFAPVRVDARAFRIPPTQTVNVAVTLTGIPAGKTVAIDVEGSGGANGTASISAGATPTASGTVTVLGGVQTTPGSARHLKLRAKLGASVIGRSAGFSVAAWPKDWTNAYVGDINGGGLGLSVQDGWKSDGSGAISELDKAEITEVVDLQSRDNPPFTIVGAISGAAGTSGYNPANSLTQDNHAYPRAKIVTAGLGFGRWNLVYGQICLFTCSRTGVTGLLVPASGYTITHTVWKTAPAAPPAAAGSGGPPAPPPPPPPFKHQAVKAGAAITVSGTTSAAGSGTATSPEHTL